MMDKTTHHTLRFTQDGPFALDQDGAWKPLGCNRPRDTWRNRLRRAEPKIVLWSAVLIVIAVILEHAL